MKIKLRTIVVDCADAQRASDFYAKLLGWEKTVVEPDWVLMRDPAGGTGRPSRRRRTTCPRSGPRSRGSSRRASTWNFLVDHLKEAEAHALACGAVRSPQQFLQGVTVFFDPDGHPFCLFEDPSYQW